jgi:hypothetical protein
MFWMMKPCVWSGEGGRPLRFAILIPRQGHDLLESWACRQRLPRHPRSVRLVNVFYAAGSSLDFLPARLSFGERTS